jgi:hypothetical protein
MLICRRRRATGAMIGPFRGYPVLVAGANLTEAVHAPVHGMPAADTILCGGDRLRQEEPE